MNNILPVDLLHSRIRFLEEKTKSDYLDLKLSVLEGMDKLRPINLIKDTFKDVIESPGLKGNLLNTVVGLASGFLADKVLIGSTFNPIKKVAGLLLGSVVAGTVSSNLDAIKTKGLAIFQSLFNKKENVPEAENAFGKDM